MIKGGKPRREKYTQFYFDNSFHRCELEPTDMLMLHNSWTPDAYKKLSKSEVLTHMCTLSNILREMT